MNAPARDAVYDPLDDSSNEIRLLQLLPARYGDPTGPICCTLRRCSLDANPIYTALSYVWGDPSNTWSILVNGKVVQVTMNLLHALEQLRLDGIQCLWIDALCINQQNDVEKGHQVRKMKMIYENAEAVIAWLGVEQHGSSEAITMMKKLAILGGCFNLPESGYSEDIIYKKPAFTRDFITSTRRSGILRREPIEAMSRLMERLYWRRVWVMQEVVVAKTVLLKCGTANLSWESFSYALGTFLCVQLCLSFQEDSSDWAAMIAYDFNLLPRLVLIQPFWQRHEDGIDMLTLLDLTCNGGSLEATKARDHVYALLGLLATTDRNATLLDYTTTDEVIFTQVTQHLIHQFSPYVLVYSGLAYREKGTSWPSWVVDWTNKDAKFGAHLFPRRRQAGEILRPLNRAERDKTLHCRGMKVDEVQYTVKLANQLSNIDEVLRSLKEMGPFHGSVEAIVKTALEISANDQLYKNDIVSLVCSDVGRASQRRLHSNGNESAEGTTVDAQQRAWSVPLNLYSRQMFVTEQGRLGCGPKATQVGDLVYFIEGSNVPFLLRRREQGGFWLVSGAHIPEITDNKVWEQDVNIEEIVLH